MLSVPCSWRQRSRWKNGKRKPEGHSLFQCFSPCFDPSVQSPCLYFLYICFYFLPHSITFFSFFAVCFFGGLYRRDSRVVSAFLVSTALFLLSFPRARVSTLSFPLCMCLSLPPSLCLSLASPPLTFQRFPPFRPPDKASIVSQMLFSMECLYVGLDGLYLPSPYTLRRAVKTWSMRLHARIHTHTQRSLLDIKHCSSLSLV